MISPLSTAVCKLILEPTLGSNSNTVLLCHLLVIMVCYQVAEMHGELMEFNEMLHRTISSKDSMLRRVQRELVDLRGPVSILHCPRG